MKSRYDFPYYYGNEAEQFSFFKIPKLLVTHEYFRDLSNDAKILYGLLLDRMSLSVKNKWFDEENRAYIVCSIDEIVELLNCSRNKAIKSLQELDTEKGIGLIEKRRLGQGNNSIMYVKNFLIEQDMHARQPNTADGSEVQNVNFQKSKIRTSKSPKNQLLEVPIIDHSKTYNSDTEHRETESTPIVSGKTLEQGRRYDAGFDPATTTRAYRSLIRKNIEYDCLLWNVK